MKPYEFNSLRSDWYNANTAVPRAFKRHISGKQELLFRGFPSYWIPFFEWFEVPWEKTKPPKKYMPFFSDLLESEIVRIVEEAKRNGSLRALVEASSSLSSVLSDFLYIMDHTTTRNSKQMDMDLAEFSDEYTVPEKRLKINSWQSYGRPSVRAFENKIYEIQSDKKVAVALPCSLSRPYGKSRTHKKIYQLLEARGYDTNFVHKIVITSLGIIPEELWGEPQVLAYDAGVPDIYRLLRIGRRYFSINKYEKVVDCLQFEPYSDILRILHNEKLINILINIDGIKKTGFLYPKLRADVGEF